MLNDQTSEVAPVEKLPQMPNSMDETVDDETHASNQAINEKPYMFIIGFHTSV